MAHASTHYTYGDSDDAAARLALLAQAYEPSSARLLQSLTTIPWPSAVDLGCGLGFTTDLLRRTVGASAAWGLDASARLVDKARARWSPACTFAVHDVTRGPLPVADVAVFYARYLLTHVASPAAVLTACAAVARTGCTLVIEEGCGLRSEDPLFVDYYAKVQRMHRHYGQDLYVGMRLADLVQESRARWQLESYARTPIVLDARRMARLHAMNVRSWRRDPFASATFDAAELDAMTEAMDDVAAGARPAPPVTCTMGQVVAVLK